jgi:hypothetical protein
MKIREFNKRPAVENGAYTQVREYFNPRDNTVPPKAGASDGVLRPLLISLKGGAYLERIQRDLYRFVYPIYGGW